MDFVSNFPCVANASKKHRECLEWLGSCRDDGLRFCRMLCCLTDSDLVQKNASGESTEIWFSFINSQGKEGNAHSPWFAVADRLSDIVHAFFHRWCKAMQDNPAIPGGFQEWEHEYDHVRKIIGCIFCMTIRCVHTKLIEHHMGERVVKMMSTGYLGLRAAAIILKCIHTVPPKQANQAKHSRVELMRMAWTVVHQCIAVNKKQVDLCMAVATAYDMIEQADFLSSCSFLETAMHKHGWQPPQQIQDILSNKNFYTKAMYVKQQQQTNKETDLIKTDYYIKGTPVPEAGDVVSA